MTESGVAKVEEMLGIENLYEHVNTPLVHHMQNALRAKELYKRDVEYVVVDGEVKIVDEFTGRVLEGRRYSEGLHQAIEAKEGVRIKEENQTLATITIQNYFKMYEKSSGMTGTAKTQQTEFEETYKLGVIEIPTNRRMIRADEQDLIYKNEDAKWNARRSRTSSSGTRRASRSWSAPSRIEKSELLSGYAQPARRPASRAEREEPRAGGHDRRPGRPKGRRRRSRRTWPAEAWTSCWAATPNTWRARRWPPRLGQRPRTCCSRWTTRSAPAYEAEYEPILREVQGADRRRARGGRRAGRAVRPGDGAPRVPPHRQPAPRPFRPTGRPGRVGVLSLARATT